MQGFVRNPKTGWRKIGRETIVLDFEKKRLIGLNAGAGWLWDQLENSQSLAWLTAELKQALPTLTEGQVAAFLTALAEDGLLIQQPGEVAAAGNESQLPQGKLELPAIVWQEPLQQVAGTCALVSGQSVLCNQAPFS